MKALVKTTNEVIQLDNSPYSVQKAGVFRLSSQSKHKTYRHTRARLGQVHNRWIKLMFLIVSVRYNSAC